MCCLLFPPLEGRWGIAGVVHGRGSDKTCRHTSDTIKPIQEGREGRRDDGDVSSEKSDLG